MHNQPGSDDSKVNDHRGIAPVNSPGFTKFLSKQENIKMEKKVDDVKLLEMLRDGIEQKRIAAYFGCAPSYITKRKKRLQVTEIEEPPTFATLTDQQKKFCIAKAEGKTNVQAVTDSYEVTSAASAKSLGYTLMKNGEIQKAIAELMEEIGMGRHYRVRKLKSHVENLDPSISLRALDMGFRLADDYPAIKSRNLNINANIMDLHPVDLSRYGMPRVEDVEDVEDEPERPHKGR